MNSAYLKNKQLAEKTHVKELLYGVPISKIDFKQRQKDYIKQLEFKNKEVRPIKQPIINHYAHIPSRLMEEKPIHKPKPFRKEGLHPIKPFGTILRSKSQPIIKDKHPNKLSSSLVSDLEAQEDLIIKEMANCKNSDRKQELLDRLNQLHLELKMQNRSPWK